MLPLDTPFEQRMKYLEENENSPEHVELRQRLRKTLYYGKMTTIERPSLAMTELAVELLQDLAPRELGRIDMYWASSLSRDLSASPCALMIAMMYVKRLKHRDSKYLSQISSSDLFLISMLVASKFLYDEGEEESVSNDEWAYLANIDVDDLNDIERKFLTAIDWNLYVSSEDFWNSLLGLEKKVAWKMSLKRDSFTYTDLFIIASDGLLQQRINHLLSEICKIVFVCSLAYTACVMTVVFSKVALTFVSSLVVLPLSLPANVISPAVLPMSVEEAQPSINFTIANTSVDCPLVACDDVYRNDDRSVAAAADAGFVTACVCEPVTPEFHPVACFHMSACLTVVMVQEIFMSNFGVLYDALSSALSAGGVGSSGHVGEPSVGGRGSPEVHGLPDVGLCRRCGHHGQNPKSSRRVPYSHRSNNISGAKTRLELVTNKKPAADGTLDERNQDEGIHFNKIMSWFQSKSPSSADNSCSNPGVRVLSNQNCSTVSPNILALFQIPKVFG